MRTAGRAIVLVVLGSWLAPGAAVLATVLHLDVHHHRDDREAAPARALALRLAEAAEHGHSHDVATPEHDHAATQGERLVAAAVAGSPAHPVTLDRLPIEALAELPPPERPPPRPLFALHCSLLR